MMRLNIASARLEAGHAGVFVSLKNHTTPFFVFRLSMNHGSPFVSGIGLPLWVKRTTKSALEFIRYFVFCFSRKCGSKSRVFSSGTLFCEFAKNFALPFWKWFSLVVTTKFPRFLPNLDAMLKKKFSNTDFGTPKFFGYIVNTFVLFFIQVYKLFSGWFLRLLGFSTLSNRDTGLFEPIAYSSGRKTSTGFGYLCGRHFPYNIHFVEFVSRKHKFPTFNAVT